LFSDSFSYILRPFIGHYFYCRWTIKARVTAKSDIRRWSNAKGEGTLFNIDLLDSEGGEIRATFFKEACDKFFPILEAGKVFNNHFFI
jgi:replication factor A1